MPEFRVIYTIDVEAETPTGAAKQAYNLMVDPTSLPPVLEVKDQHGNVTEVDLYETEEEDGGGVKKAQTDD